MLRLVSGQAGQMRVWRSDQRELERERERERGRERKREREKRERERAVAKQLSGWLYECEALWPARLTYTSPRAHDSY